MDIRTNNIHPVVNKDINLTIDSICRDEYSATNNTIYKKVFNIVLSGNIALMAFTASSNTTYAQGHENNEEIISPQNMVSNTNLKYKHNYYQSSFIKKAQNEELFTPINNNNSQLFTKHLIYNLSHTEILKLNTDMDMDDEVSLFKTLLIDGLNEYDEADTKINNKEGVDVMISDKSIEKNINFTYKFATISLTSLAAISFSSMAGLDFIPSPIDNTIFITTAAGALGFLIDNLKREKNDGRYKTV